MNLTDDLKDADCLVIKEATPINSAAVADYQDLFRAFGFEYSFKKSQLLDSEDRKFAYLLNNTSFFREGFNGWRLGAYRLPYNKQENQQFNFEEISEKAPVTLSWLCSSWM